MEQESRRKEAYLYVYKCGWRFFCESLSIKIMTIQEKSRDQHLIDENNNLERKKGSTLNCRGGEVGKESEAMGKGEGQNWALSPFPGPQWRKQILTWIPYVESSSLKRSFCFYLLFLWGIHFGSNFLFSFAVEIKRLWVEQKWNTLFCTGHMPDFITISFLT